MVLFRVELGPAISSVWSWFLRWYHWLQQCDQAGKVVAHCLPHAEPVDLIVSMDEAMPHADDLPPRYLAVCVPESRG